MVPAADILNHLANHNANLEYSSVSGTPPPSCPVQIQECLSLMRLVIGLNGLQFPCPKKVKLAPPVCIHLYIPVVSSSYRHSFAYSREVV